MKKPRKMAAILATLVKAAKGKRFIEKYENKPAFNYYQFTQYCHELAEETNSEYGYALRDIAMEQLDPKFNRNKPYHFLGMPVIEP